MSTTTSLSGRRGTRYLVRDRDRVYGEGLSGQAKTLDIWEAVIAPRFAKRVCRKSDWLDSTGVL